MQPLLCGRIDLLNLNTCSLVKTNLYKEVSAQPIDMEVDIRKLGLDRLNPEFIPAGYCAWSD